MQNAAVYVYVSCSSPVYPLTVYYQNSMQYPSGTRAQMTFTDGLGDVINLGNPGQGQFAETFGTSHAAGYNYSIQYSSTDTLCNCQLVTYVNGNPVTTPVQNNTLATGTVGGPVSVYTSCVELIP